MNPMKKISALVRVLFGKNKLDADMAEEMRIHLERRTQANIAAGMSEEEARYAAQRQFGGMDQLKEVAREQRGAMWLEHLLRHFRFAGRQLVKAPGFTAVAVLTIALGVGLNTAMFSMLNGFLLRPLAYPEAHRLFRLDRSTPQGFSDSHSAPNFDEISRASSGIAELTAYRFWAFTLSDGDQPPEVPLALGVSGNFFNVLGIQPREGRSFIASEDVAGKNNVIVISHRYWQSRFKGDPKIVGRTVRLDGFPVEIVGVLPRSEDTLRLFGPIAIYRPMALSNEQKVDRTPGFRVIGRYRGTITPKQAAGQFETIGRQLAAVDPQNAGTGLRLVSLQSVTLTGISRTMTFLLVGLSGFVLLIACANLANLLLARSLARGREFSIRAALGASRTQLIAPLVAECFLLTLAGAAGAALVSRWGTVWLGQRFGDPSSPADFSPDVRVWAFTIGASVVTAFLFGVTPAWLVARIDSNDALKNNSRGFSGGRSQTRFRQALIVTQFALALVLLAGAGFFIRGVERLSRVESGWNPDALISGSLNLASEKYNRAEPIIAFHTQLRERLLALPGVANSAVSFEEPLYSSPAQRRYIVEGRPLPPAGQEPLASTNGVSASYFDTVGTRLLRGRLIDHTDQLTSRPVVVINEAMARSLFGDEDPLGRRLGLAGQADPYWAEIVGVVEDVKSPRVGPPPTLFAVYKPYVQEAWQYVTITIRAADPSKVSGLLEPIRRTVASLDPDQPVLGLQPSLQRIERENDIWQTIRQLLVLFAGLGLLLAALGMYGLISRLVLQRTGEIGIRMALGAQIRDIIGLVLGGGLRMAVVGTIVGLVGAGLLGRFLTAEMPVFGGAIGGPIATAAGVLIVVALSASYLPARRAAKVDPVVALRSE
jgi:putative ABC transport system permease protein